jgi:hypothetical protein
MQGNSTITSTTPAISTDTPMRVITAIFVTPNEAIAMHTAMQTEPRMIALSAPVGDVGDGSPPRSWTRSTLRATPPAVRSRWPRH